MQTFSSPECSMRHPRVASRRLGVTSLKAKIKISTIRSYTLGADLEHEWVNQIDLDTDVVFSEQIMLVISLKRCWVVFNESECIKNEVNYTSEYLSLPKEYCKNFGSNGISGSVFVYLTRQIRDSGRLSTRFSLFSLLKLLSSF